MNTYKTSEIAKIIDIHPNTVRFYEELGFITKPERKSNGYRIFTDVHLEQLKLVRLVLRAEVTQNGLRKKAIAIIKASATGEYKTAIKLAQSYLDQIVTEQINAEEAIDITRQLISKEKVEIPQLSLTRKEAANYLNISIDTLRTWEINGLLTVKRQKNGYRIYNESDIRILKIIHSLRCANYSLASILRMLNSISSNPEVNLRKIIDTPQETEDIISVCDRLLTSLQNLNKDAQEMIVQLEKMKKQFK